MTHKNTNKKGVGQKAERRFCCVFVRIAQSAGLEVVHSLKNKHKIQIKNNESTETCHCNS